MKIVGDFQEVGGGFMKVCSDHDKVWSSLCKDFLKVSGGLLVSGGWLEVLCCFTRGFQEIVELFGSGWKLTGDPK